MTVILDSKSDEFDTLEHSARSGIGLPNNGGDDGSVGSLPPPPDTGEHTVDDKPFLLKDLEVGQDDKRGRNVLDILWAVEDFKIYKTKQGVGLHFSDDSEEALRQRRKYLDLGEELAHVNHLIHLLKRKSRWYDLQRERTEDDPALIHSQREMARSIAQALTTRDESEEPVAGKAALVALACRLEKRLRNKGRIFYLMICLCITAIVVAVTLGLPQVPKESMFFIDTTKFFGSEIGLVVAMGSIGALFSTAVGLRGLVIDADSRPTMSVIFGLQRMLAGVLGAIVLYLAIRGGVMDQVFSFSGDPVGSGDNQAKEGPSNDAFRIAFFSVLAGFSERLVPNLLEREQNRAESNPDE